jgi:hypothetical protein
MRGRSIDSFFVIKERVGGNVLRLIGIMMPVLKKSSHQAGTPNKQKPSTTWFWHIEHMFDFTIIFSEQLFLAVKKDLTDCAGRGTSQPDTGSNIHLEIFRPIRSKNCGHRKDARCFLRVPFSQTWKKFSFSHSLQKRQEAGHDHYFLKRTT